MLVKKHFIPLLFLVVGLFGTFLFQSKVFLNSSIHVPSEEFPSVSTSHLDTSTVDTSTSSSSSSFETLPILGIFCTAADVSRRKSIRSTWANSPLVCSRPDQYQNSCRYRLLFVIGESSGDVTAENATSGDIVKIPCPENMNDGKSLTWFNYSITAYPRADWIFKVDSDAYIIIQSLHKVLSVASPLFPIYFGFMADNILCGGWDWCPRGWVYMSGQLYGITRKLFENMPRNIFDTQPKGFEDIEFGRLLYLTSHQTSPYMYYPTRGTKLEENRHLKIAQECPFLDQFSWSMSGNDPLWFHNVKTDEAFSSIHECILKLAS
eukprot:GILI01014561.1.p1 GENE.GILI01014561.1~~GILI01014561.1.p1  ORF type:complete len:321 (+),score=-0.50 GILI01014561.1:38-1000(+)